MTNLFPGIDIDAIHNKLDSKKPKKHHKTTGYCLSCNATLSDRAFCDNWCKEDYGFEGEIKATILKSKR